MSELIEHLDGKNNEIKWFINIRQSVSGLFYAVVQVGTWVVVTPEYVKQEVCHDAACTRMADMLAEVEDMINA